MLINITNHPSNDWGKEQLDASVKFGEIVDIPFPAIAPEMNTSDIFSLATGQADSLEILLCTKPGQDHAVHVMGEMTFCFAVICILQKKGILCLASTTQRNTIASENGRKMSEFQFAGFRAYHNPFINHGH